MQRRLVGTTHSDKKTVGVDSEGRDGALEVPGSTNPGSPTPDFSTVRIASGGEVASRLEQRSIEPISTSEAKKS